MKKFLRQFSSDEFEELIKSLKCEDITIAQKNLEGQIETPDLQRIEDSSNSNAIESIVSNFEKTLEYMTRNNSLLDEYFNRQDLKQKELLMEQAAYSANKETKVSERIQELKREVQKIKQAINKVTEQSSGNSGMSIGGFFGGSLGGLGKIATSKPALIAAGGVAATAGVAAVGVSTYNYINDTKVDEPKGSTAEHMLTLYNAFVQRGMSDEGAKTMIAQINRENNFQEKYLFGIHIDPANNAVNSGIISWQGSRGSKFLNYMKSRGLIKNNKMERSARALEAQADFLVEEMKSNPEYKKSWKVLTDSTLSYNQIESVVGDNYIKWRRTDPKYSKSGYRNQNRGYSQITSLLKRKSTLNPNSNISSIAPEATRLSSNFGMRNQRMHKGIDIAAPAGSPALSLDAGIVTISKYERGGYGNWIEIAHGEGQTTRYAHLSDVFVKKGDKVQRGQKIGTVGSTGRSSGPHLHFEVRNKGRAVDPTQTLSKYVYRQVVYKDPKTGSPTLGPSPIPPKQQTKGSRPTVFKPGAASGSFADFYKFTK